MACIVSGIQQIGIGISDVEEAWAWYRSRFGMDIPIFREAAEAPYMTRYTGGTVQSRDAVLAVNLRGGGAFEIWQYTSRKTVFPEHPPRLGDTGIFAARLKSDNPAAAYSVLKDKAVNILGPPALDPSGRLSFFVCDPYGNLFQIAHADDFFLRKGSATAGPSGAMIGVSDMDKALGLYRDVLGFDHVIYDESDTFADLAPVEGGQRRIRRLLLTRSESPRGPFAPLFGRNTLELVQALDDKPARIFEGRFWGDGGFIHLCFDVQGMDDLGLRLSDAGFPFTIDSGASFEMGEAAGRFTYCEDPDGTLIEFVETGKIPIVGKWNWYLDLRRRPAGKSLPRIVLRALGLGRVRE